MSLASFFYTHNMNSNQKKGINYQHFDFFLDFIPAFILVYIPQKKLIFIKD
jgi:hypothetical protein